VGVFHRVGVRTQPGDRLAPIPARAFVVAEYPQPLRLLSPEIRTHSRAFDTLASFFYEGGLGAHPFARRLPYTQGGGGGQERPGAQPVKRTAGRGSGGAGA